MNGSGPSAQRILVCVAWPYAHSGTHVGQIAGSVLPGDIFARYHRMAGHDVLMISGSDEHGTPITVDAERAGISPRDLVARYHPQIVAAFHQLGISWDLYTETDTAHHRQVCQAVFLRLLERGYLFTDTVESLYCPTDRRFLPDRYVQGSCPYCGDPAARGDQCEACGRTLDPTQLLEPRCRLCGSRESRVETRLTEHVFLDLPQFEARLLAWLEQARAHWRPNVVNLVLNWIKEGLTPRAVTRDLEWGIPVPLDGFAGKCIYVWLDALIGYYSASLEWATRQGDPSLWERWWRVGRDGEQPARSYYFIGKDNIPFHAIIWPAVLMGVGGLALPFDVPANEFMLMGGHKASASSGNVIWTQDVLDRYGADPVRYYLAATMPETQDSTFSHEDLVRRNNDELVAIYGNLVHRVLTFAQREFGGVVPAPATLDPLDLALLADTRAALAAAATAIEGVHLREGLRHALGLARKANRYLQERAPWVTVKSAREEAGTTVFTILQALSGLGTLFAPYLPFSSRRLHHLLGFAETEAPLAWALEPVPAGQRLPAPTPLFAKFEAPATAASNSDGSGT